MVKKLILCDSGLGGLNVAENIFNAPPGGEAADILYFNAYPAPRRGFNTMDAAGQEQLFREILESMQKFNPDQVMIACNTLSIVYDRLKKYYTPPFPVQGIVDAAVSGMQTALEQNNEAELLILGTKSTVESNVYADALCQKGIAKNRIKSLACPGLATLLESGPDAAEAAEAVKKYAAEAVKLFDHPVKKLLLGLCCTHFAFAAPHWLKYFQAAFGCPVELVNPNELMVRGFSAESFAYTSRIEFFDGAREAMTGYFAPKAPMIAAGLENALIDKKLFPFEE